LTPSYLDFTLQPEESKMKRLYSTLIFFSFSMACWAQQSVFQGRIDMGRDLASFETVPPVAGTLYLLTGAAGSIRILSQEPFVAEVDFVQGEWKGESDLLAHRVLLRFEGAGWAKTVVAKKPRQGAESLVYPYRRFQAAALPMPGGFKVISLPFLF
jgi:hypothetical protein